MEKIIWTDPAKRSLKNIWQVYSRSNPDIADRIVSEIIVAVESLQFSEQYQVEEIAGVNYRKIVIRHFKITFRPLEKGILVIQIFDIHQNPEN